MSIYPNRTDRAVADARAALATHRLDPETPRCGVRASGAPTQAANLPAELRDLSPAPAADRPLLTYGWRLTFGLIRRPAPPTPTDERTAIEGEWR